MEYEEYLKWQKQLQSNFDDRYVLQEDCNERQEKVNKKFANDDKRIELVQHDFCIIKKLMWAMVSATIGSLVVAFLELIFK